MLKKHSSISKKEYEVRFDHKDFNLPFQKRNSQIAKSKFADEVGDRLALNKENYGNSSFVTCPLCNHEFSRMGRKKGWEKVQYKMTWTLVFKILLHYGTLWFSEIFSD